VSDEREMIKTLRSGCDNAWYRTVMERAADMLEQQCDDIECYEGMKEGVSIRIAELEQRLAAAEGLQQKLEYSQQLYRDADKINAEMAARLAAAEGLLRDFATNWDCDEDGHKYGTGCRACHATNYFERDGEEVCGETE
jgi:hypothetical protein